MGSRLRSVLAVTVGVISGGVLVGLVEMLGHRLYPPPPGMDPGDPESIGAFMDLIPVESLLFVALAWAVGSFAGAAVAARLAGRAPWVHGMTVGLFFLAAGIANLVAIPHPAWFWFVGMAVFLPAAYLGVRLTLPRAVEPA